MGVVFDEVTTSIQPETRPAAKEGAKAPAPEESEMKIRHLLCKLEQREARLRAD
jgi:hypothetical protein